MPETSELAEFALFVSSNSCPCIVTRSLSPPPLCHLFWENDAWKSFDRSDRWIGMTRSLTFSAIAWSLCKEHYGTHSIRVGVYKISQRRRRCSRRLQVGRWSGTQYYRLGVSGCRLSFHDHMKCKSGQEHPHISALGCPEPAPTVESKPESARVPSVVTRMQHCPNQLNIR